MSPNTYGKLLPGSYVEISINIIGKDSPLVVPANVLVIDQAGTHVVIVDAENRIGFRSVKLGRDFGREVEILEGMTANDVLVASPSDLLVEGETVKVVEAQKSADKVKDKNAVKSWSWDGYFGSRIVGVALASMIVAKATPTPTAYWIPLI